MTSLLPLAVALSLPGCAGDEGTKSLLEPCEEGMAVTADGEAHASLADAVARAVELDGVVDVCPGRHDVEGYLDLLSDAPAPTVTITGAGVADTVLVPAGLGLSSDASSRPVRLSHLTIEQSATAWTGDDCTPWDNESDLECDSPFDRDGYPEGALLLAGSWVFERVRVRQNEGYWGGALTATLSLFGGATTIHFLDSEFVSNTAVESSSGGAVLVAIAEPYYDAPYQVTIISTNTDWGTGDADNTPDDIAFASWDGYFHDSLTVHASYSFDGVADFTCDATTYVCE